MSPVFLDTRARAVIERQAVARRLLESGGSLFGWEVDAGVFVACASGPGPRARHRPCSFAPAPEVVEVGMSRVYELSEGRYGYLGSWHTHPRGSAVPSTTDTGTAEAMAAQTDLRLSRPVLLIVATTGSRRHVRARELRAWRWHPEKRRLEEDRIEDMLFPERYCPATEMLFAGD